nr:sialidase-like [Procambarus clarkii]
MDHSNDEIIAEIERKNRDVKILQAHRFTTQRNNQVLKLTLASPEQATQVCTQGLSAFGIMAEPDKINPQRFYKLKQCFKCFQYDHYSNACNNGTPKCSRCTGEHSYRECTNPTPKCALCNGPHIAISHLCPRRQEAIKQLHETETAARQQAAITIPAPPPPVNAWGIPNQQQAQSVAQGGHQSTQHPHNPTVIPEQTQNQTQQAPTPNSLATNPDPKPSLGAELLTFAQIQFPDNPVKLLGFWNSLRKDNGLPPVHMSEDSLAYLTPNITTTAGQAQAQPNNPNPSTPRPQASTNAHETPNSLNNPGPSTPTFWETPMSTLPETLPHQIVLKAITNSLAIRNPIRPRKFRFKHRSPTTIYSTQRCTKRPRPNSRTPSPVDGARASNPHNSSPESDSSTTDVDIMNSSDTEDPPMAQQRMIDSILTDSANSSPDKEHEVMVTGPTEQEEGPRVQVPTDTQESGGKAPEHLRYGKVDTPRVIAEPGFSVMRNTLRARHSDPQSSPLRPLELPTQTLRAPHSDPQSSPLRPSELTTQTLRARHSGPQSSPLRRSELTTQTLRAHHSDPQSSPLKPSKLTTQTLRVHHSNPQSSPLRPSELTTQSSPLKPSKLTTQSSPLRASELTTQSSTLRASVLTTQRLKAHHSELTTQSLRAHHSKPQSSPLRAHHSEPTTQSLRAHHSEPQSSPLRASELATQTLRAHHSEPQSSPLRPSELTTHHWITTASLPKISRPALRDHQSYPTP